MKAVILVGGEGTRLRPLTLSTPKAVVPVVDRPLLRYQLDLLAQAGVDEVVFSVAYQPDKIRAVFGTGDGTALRIRYAVEETPLGTGGAVKNAEGHLDSTTIVFNGDVLTDVDLPAVIARHRAAGASASIVLTPVPNPAAYGLVEADEHGRVQRFIEKPDPAQITTNRINAGIYVIETATLELIPPAVKHSIERGFFPALLARGDHVEAFVHEGYWIDIGTPEKYLQVHRDVLRRRFLVPLAARESAGGWVHERADVHPKARLEAPFFIGPGCRVGPGAEVGPDAALLSRVEVGEEARIADSVLWDACSVGPRSSVQGALLGRGVRLGHSVSLAPGAVLGQEAALPDFSRTG